ncbi:MAG: hypothetical protein ABIP51_04105 [Bacteroidia bacterium]
MKVEVSGENYQKQERITDFIIKHLKQINKDTGHFSTHIHTIRHESFKELVLMGDKIIPYLFHLMLEEGGSWTYFLLLQEITKEQPVKKENYGKFIHSTIDWLQWYVNSKYYPSDIYFGLVE